MAISVGTKAAALLVFAFVVAPAIGFGLKRLTGGWKLLRGRRVRDPQGGGAARARGAGADRSGDPGGRGAPDAGGEGGAAARAAADPEIDVEAESARLLAAGRGGAHRGARRGAAGGGSPARRRRNERAGRQGLEPLDVESETARKWPSWRG